MRPAPISIQAVRLMQLAAQGLLEPPPQRPSQKQDVLAAIRRMGVLQIDTISVVARSPYMVLFSRIGDYTESWLDELLAGGDLFEYWAHAACFVPIEDYPIYRRMMLDHLRGWKEGRQWLAERAALVAMILNRIRAEGPLRSADFERKDGKGNGWWDWKEEKIALEQLFDAGILSIARREKFQR
ncbi:MAG TPA: crosslink repair DNA glycosylase YcaQ family protein, partial [Levilinea sp.]|nr:crosslink repair DNA glycosylase YcaQ family protein [Levilinea sp.]